MLLIDILQADRAVQELDTIERKIQKNVMCLHEIIRVVKGDLQIEGLESHLERQMAEMQELEWSIKEYGQALHQICEVYQTTERKMAEYMEESETAYRIPAFQTWVIPEWIFQVLR